MPSTKKSSMSSETTLSSSPQSSQESNYVTATAASEPARFPMEEGFDIVAYRKTPECQQLTDWVLNSFSKARTDRTKKQQQWQLNMAFYLGKQWLQQGASSLGFTGNLVPQKVPYYRGKKTINRIRSFVRTEQSKFISQTPVASVIPATAEDEDMRSAFAAEQAWQSISNSQKLDYHFERAAWWMTLTGVGFIKTYWDGNVIDKVSGQPGNIRYGAVSPFHLFVPDLREIDIEDQPYIINAYSKPVAWAKSRYEEELKGVTLTPTHTSTQMDESYLDLTDANKVNNDSILVYEMWVKPGTTKEMPQGGMIVVVDKFMVEKHIGMPYNHNEYPFAKLEHIPTGAFYPDSPVSDIIELQREFNTLRSEISEAGRRMAKPQLIVAKGSLVPGKLTNEPGSVIEYRPGMPAPQPLQLSPLPEYYVVQQDRILTDIQDLTGQHEVSRGSAPGGGITAGTAISFLKESDDQYLSPQYHSVEYAYEKIAGQTIGLFIQYVKLPRKIKTIGADQAYDTMILSGADVKSGTDIRIERGSSIGQSQAAKRAEIKDYFSIGLIDANQALQMLEMGGVQRYQDTMNVAKSKAQRENIKMKQINEAEIMRYEDDIVAKTLQGMDPASLEQITAAGEDPEQLIRDELPSIIPVDDFDIHELHIEVHNQFRMSQEFEALPDSIKQQFAKHVAAHQEYVAQQQMQQFLDQIPSDGTEGVPLGGEPPQDPFSGGMEQMEQGAPPMA